MSEKFCPASQEQYKAIEGLAGVILDRMGTVKNLGGIQLRSVVLGVSEPALVGDLDTSILPTISISQPFKKGETLWNFEIVYGAQDAGKSLHLLLGEDEILGEHIITTSYHVDGRQDLLSQSQASKLIFDLRSQINE